MLSKFSELGISLHRSSVQRNFLYWRRAPGMCYTAERRNKVKKC